MRLVARAEVVHKPKATAPMFAQDETLSRAPISASNPAAGALAGARSGANSRSNSQPAQLPRLILASGSKARSEMLRAAGFVFDVVPADIDERAAEASYFSNITDRSVGNIEKSKRQSPARALDNTNSMASRGLALHLAHRKAQDVAVRTAQQAATDTRAHTKADTPPACIIGADQILIFEGEILHKCTTRAEAAALLARMAGRTHTLISAAVLLQGDAVLARLDDVVTLRMRPLSPSDIAAYLDACPPDILSSVGCYQLEGLGAGLFEAIDGAYHTVLGMPLLGLISALDAAGIRPAYRGL